jgi:hypothetical protein
MLLIPPRRFFSALPCEATWEPEGCWDPAGQLNAKAGGNKHVAKRSLGITLPRPPQIQSDKHALHPHMLILHTHPFFHCAISP